TTARRIGPTRTGAPARSLSRESSLPGRNLLSTASRSSNGLSTAFAHSGARSGKSTWTSDPIARKRCDTSPRGTSRSGDIRLGDRRRRGGDGRRRGVAEREVARLLVEVPGRGRRRRRRDRRRGVLRGADRVLRGEGDERGEAERGRQRRPPSQDPEVLLLRAPGIAACLGRLHGTDGTRTR